MDKEDFKGKVLAMTNRSFEMGWAAREVMGDLGKDEEPVGVDVQEVGMLDWGYEVKSFLITKGDWGNLPNSQALLVERLLRDFNDLVRMMDHGKK